MRPAPKQLPGLSRQAGGMKACLFCFSKGRRGGKGLERGHHPPVEACQKAADCFILSACIIRTAAAFLSTCEFQSRLRAKKAFIRHCC